MSEDEEGLTTDLDPHEPQLSASISSPENAILNANANTLYPKQPSSLSRMLTQLFDTNPALIVDMNALWDRMGWEWMAH